MSRNKSTVRPGAHRSARPAAGGFVQRLSGQFDSDGESLFLCFDDLVGFDLLFARIAFFVVWVLATRVAVGLRIVSAQNLIEESLKHRRPINFLAFHMWPRGSIPGENMRQIRLFGFNRSFFDCCTEFSEPSNYCFAVLLIRRRAGDPEKLVACSR
jgi:hypothetical protein